MEFPEILEMVNVECETAKGLHLSGRKSLAISTLQGVATIINGEFGATDEVAAASPEDEKASDEDELADLLTVIEQIEELVSVARGAVMSGHLKAACDPLLKVAQLITKMLTSESS